jgi:virginiamycin B lyase
VTITSVAPVLGRWIRRPWLWLVVVAAGLVALASALVLTGRVGPWADSGFVEHPMPARTDIPVAIAVAPDGVVWFTIELSDAIGRLRDGRIERLRKGGESLEPLGLATAADGSAWFTDASRRAISRISSDGTVSSFDVSTPVARLGRLAVAPDGAVWFAEPTMVSVTRLKAGVFTRFAIAPSAGVGEGGVGPFGVAVDPQGNVWATLPPLNKVVRLAPTGQMAEFELPTPRSGPGDIAVDARGTVWVLEQTANKVARFADGRFDEIPVPTANAGLTALAVGPDASAWFTEARARKLGRVRGSVVREFALPRADARPIGIAVDRDGNVWYADLRGWIGMLRADRARAN